MKLTRLQNLWLYSRGGRNKSDVIDINGEPFIEMVEGRGRIEISKIPSNEYLDRTRFHLRENYERELKKRG